MDCKCKCERDKYKVPKFKANPSWHLVRKKKSEMVYKMSDQK